MLSYKVAEKLFYIALIMTTKYTITIPILLAFLSLSLVFGALPANAQSAPSISGEAANVTGSHNATLSVFVNTNGSITSLEFKYWTGTVFKSKYYFGVSGSSRIEVGLINLFEGTTYSYQVFAKNSFGSVTGNTNTFITYGSNGSGNFGDTNNTNSTSGSGNSNSTSQGFPIVATNGPVSVSTTSAVINGTINPNGSLTNFWFEFGTAQSLGQMTTTQSIGNSNSGLLVTGNLSGLENGRTYYYRVTAQNAYGINRGEIRNFITGSGQNSSSTSSGSGGQVLGAVSGTGNGSGSQTSAGTTKTNTAKTTSSLGSTQTNSRPSFISLEYSLADNGALVVVADDIKPKPGEEFSHTVVYKNDGTASFNESTLKVIVPVEAEYISASVEPVRISGNVVELNLGHISPGSNGSIVIVSKVKETTKSGANMIFTSVLGYKDRLGTQLATTSYLTIMVGDLDSSSSASLLGFLSGSATIWLVVLGLIVMISLAVYKLISIRKNGKSDEEDIFGLSNIPPTFEKVDVSMRRPNFVGAPMGKPDVFRPIK